MMRQHSAEEALQAFRLARSAGFNNINMDLIAGYPQQTVRGFLEGLDLLIQLRPDHLSIYLLEMHESTTLSRQITTGIAQVMPEEDQLQIYTEAIRILQHAGYRHYEVSNFALPGRESQHNLKYWSDAPYYAYGAGASSYLQSTRTTNLREIPRYIDALENSRTPVESKTAEDQETRVRNALIFGLRKRDGIDLTEFEKKYGVPAVSLFHDQAKEFLEAGFLEIHGRFLRLTLSGMMVSNEILDSAL